MERAKTGVDHDNLPNTAHAILDHFQLEASLVMPITMRSCLSNFDGRVYRSCPVEQSVFNLEATAIMLTSLSFSG